VLFLGFHLLPLFDFSQSELDSLIVKGQVSRADYKISKAAFIEKYNIDDTTRVIVNLFYRKKKKAFVKAASLPISLLLMTAAIKGEEDNDVVPAPAVSLAFFGAVLPSTFISASGFTDFSTYSRKRLLQTIINYKNSKPWHPRVQRKLDKEFARIYYESVRQ
jgi:hypothetical protein